MYGFIFLQKLNSLNMDRRTFLAGGTASALSPLALKAVNTSSSHPREEDITAPPARFIQQRYFRQPVIIESMDLFHHDGSWFVRARSKDGAEGWAIAHNNMRNYYPIFTNIIAPNFVGRDARELDQLVDDVYLVDANYKLQGQPFWVPVASAEFAVLDLLGAISGKAAGDILGGIRRREIPLYIANNHRNHDPEDSLRRIVASVDKIDAQAVKFKLGGRMKVVDQIPGRTKALISMVAEALGSRCTLYADANSSYVDVDYAIHIGKLLEKHGFAFYEEPCPFDYLEETKRVADALDIPIAWGEQESSQWRFQWMIRNGGVQVAQPDIFYFGGLIRSLRVAKWAEQQGLPATPHISGGGLGFLYMGIYACCCPNPGAFQEYKGINRHFPWESTGQPFSIKNGVMTAPTGPGIGVRFDPDYLKSAKQVSAL